MRGAMTRLVVFWFSISWFLLGCGDDEARPTPDAGSDDGGVDAPDPDRIIADRPECENLNPNHCLLPWPSSRYLVADPRTETGWRVEIPREALPKNQYDEPASPDAWMGFDGFSPMTSMMTLFLGRIDTSNLPDETRIADSLSPSSPTVVLDAETGERVAHFAEVDAWPQADPERRSFYIRPAQRMRENRRYIVAIRNLRLQDGTPVRPSNYFRALRDGVSTSVAELEARRAHFEEIFRILGEAGIERGTLLEAWDFRTASGRNAWGTLIAMRDDAFRRIGERGLGCTVTRVEEFTPAERAETWRRVTGTFTVPLYMQTPYEGARLNRDAMGAPAFNGMAEAPFTLVIPHSVRERMQAGGEPARLMVYGHGLLGGSDQVDSRGTRTQLQRYGMVGVGTDWWGLSAADRSVIVTEWIPDVGKFPLVGERLLQGVLNFAVLARTFMGVCRDRPEWRIGDRSAIGDEVYYHGISQGGIMGATLAGISPDIRRYALQVGGISYPIMIRRSIDFIQFEEILLNWYPDKVDRDWTIVSSQNGWDLAEPATYAPHLLSDPLPGSVPQRILYQVSRYDTEVSNLASDIAARTMGLPWFRSSVYEPWNAPSPTDGPADSGYIIYHVEGVEPIPTGTAIASMDNDAHAQLRFRDAVQRQIDAFFRPDGRVENFCDGPCDPN